MFTEKKTFLAKNMEWGIAIINLTISRQYGGGLRIQFSETHWNF